MWIKSQNKRKLIDTKNIFYQCINDEKTGKKKYLTILKSELTSDDTILCYKDQMATKFKVRRMVYDKIYVFNDDLGCYSTEEKAMKVLDMIQACISKDFSKISIEAIEKIRYISGGSFGTTDCRNLLKDNFVFQMPQDEEVR